MTKPKQRRNQRNKVHKFGAYEQQDNQIVYATVHGSSNVNSTAGGVFNVSIPMDPSGVNGTDWADFSSTYDEFRVMGARITFTSVPVNVAAINNSLVAICFDNDSTAAPTSFSQVRQYSTARIFPAVDTVKPTVFTWWRPTRGKDTAILWCDVATPATSPGAILLSADSLTISTSYLYYAVDLFIQFRGRR